MNERHHNRDDEQRNNHREKPIGDMPHLIDGAIQIGYHRLEGIGPHLCLRQLPPNLRKDSRQKGDIAE